MQTKIKAITILTLIHLLPINPETVGYSSESPLYTHFIYMFIHATWMHLIINCYALYIVYSQRLGKFTPLIIWLIAVTSSFIMPAPTPTVGMSAVTYAYIGINAAHNRKPITWIMILISLTAGLFITSVNPYIHISTFTLALITSATVKQYTKYRNDNQRITSRKQ